MQFRILGPVTVIDEDGASLPLGPPRQHALLAALLLHLGEPMPVDRLIGLLWGGVAPASAATIVHGSVAGLRHGLGHRILAALRAWLVAGGQAVRAGGKGRG